MWGCFTVPGISIFISVKTMTYSHPLPQDMQSTKEGSDVTAATPHRPSCPSVIGLDKLQPVKFEITQHHVWEEAFEGTGNFCQRFSLCSKQGQLFQLRTRNAEKHGQTHSLLTSNTRKINMYCKLLRFWVCLLLIKVIKLIYSFKKYWLKGYILAIEL